MTKPREAEGTAAPKIPGGRRIGRSARIEKARQLLGNKRKEKRERQDAREKEREVLGDEAPPKEIPKTIENMREFDETMVEPDDTEVLHDECIDEMSVYFSRKTTPKIAITTNHDHTFSSLRFATVLAEVIPNTTIYKRHGLRVKKFIKAAIAREFTDIVLLNEDRKKVNGLTLIHLPDGPTAYFKLTNAKLPKEIKRCGEMTSHFPEVILNNFNTRLGHTVARMFACLFPQDPNFVGRRAVTFHNQRDFIFFRHHRYEFKKEGEKVALHELGPRFTLKLRALQKGTFDTKFGEFEWVHKRHEMETTRRRFFL